MTLLYITTCIKRFYWFIIRQNVSGKAYIEHAKHWAIQADHVTAISLIVAIYFSQQFRTRERSIHIAIDGHTSYRYDKMPLSSSNW